MRLPLETNFPALRHVLMVVFCLVAVAGCSGMTERGRMGNDSAERKQEYEARLRLAGTAAKGGDLMSAIHIYKKLAKDYPEDAGVLLSLADVLYRADSLDAAAATYEKASMLTDEGDVRPLMGFARIGLKRLRPDEAVPFFQAVLSREPDHYEAMNGLAVSIDMMGYHRVSESLYRQLIASEPQRLDAKVNLGLSLVAQGREKEAINLLIRIARMPGSPVTARHNLAMAYALSGNVTATKEILQLDLRKGQLVENLCYYRNLSQAVRAKNTTLSTVKQDARPAPVCRLDG